MQVLEGRQALPAPFRDQGAVATVGVFDGVHLGHFHVLREVVRRAEAHSAMPVMVTFCGHPKSLLLGQAPATITSLEHRLLLFQRAGIGATLVLRFSDELRALSAEDFTTSILLDGLGLRELVFGFDSKFGKDRGGNPLSLAPLSKRLGFCITEVPALRLEGRAVSSTVIREAVGLGDLERAGRMLGRPVSLLGKVVPGDGRGKGLGFPTANLDLLHELQPPAGVYAALACRPDAPAADGILHPAVVNIGQRPTFADSGAKEAVEVHILDFDGDLYGDTIEVFFLARLRGEQRFPDQAALVQQITQDVTAARALTAKAKDSWRIPGQFLPIEGSRPDDFLS